MAREDLKTLYHVLRESEFGFLPRGTHNIRDIYSTIQHRFPDLCDDSYLCIEHCIQGNNSPEWKHRVRTALSDLQRSGVVQSAVERGTWILGADAQSGLALASDIEASLPERIETTTFRILRDTALSRALKTLHRNECQFCGYFIELSDGSRYSEAHHIRPLGRPHDGLDIPGNILILCPNHHAMLDYGAASIDINQLQHQENHVVLEKYVQYHNTVIFRGN